MYPLRLTIVGGSAASPNTGAGCSGYLIQSSGSTVFVDPGPGTLQELRRHTDFRTLDAVIVSHMHLDHFLDLLALRHALAYNPVAATRPVPVWLPPGGAAFLARATAPFDECDDPGRFDRTVIVREYDPADLLSIGELTVAFARTVHYVPTWAMRFHEAGGQSLGYTADTGPTADLAGFFSGVDILLAEATLPESTPAAPHDRGSLTASEAARLATASNAARLVLTHYWEEQQPESQQVASRAAYDGPIQLATKGNTISW